MPEQLEFHALTFVDEPEGVMVGRVGADSYFLFPADGAALLRQLADGMTPANAEQWYARCFGETVDITDFLATLGELGLIATGDAPSAPAAVGFQRLGRAILSPVALACYLAVVAVAVVELFLRPALLPRPGDVFFTSSLIVTQLVLAALQIPLVGWHELFHVLAGRRLGVPSRLGITRRWFFVVFETELNGLLGVLRRSRYLPFLAGMMADAVLFGGLTLVLTTFVDPASLAGRVLLAVRVVLVMRLIWQFFVFLRTDLYYVLSTAAGCTDLHAAGSAYLREKFGLLPGVRPASVDLRNFSARDRAAAPWFALATVVGVGFLLLTTAFGIVPVLVEFVARLIAALSSGPGTSGPFWDSVGSLALIVLNLVVLPLLAGRRRPSPIE